jgi:hypothetical protein
MRAPREQGLDIKHIEWNFEQYAFFCSGHVDRQEFIEAVRPHIEREVGDTPDELPEASDVEHIWFRMMSPSEARERGYDFGYMKAEAPAERKRGGPFPVTVVIV